MIEIDPYLSIFEFLNKSAGSIHYDLGSVVYRAAKFRGIKPLVKKVKWSKESKGKIMTYPKSFLEDVFSNSKKIKKILENAKLR